jgi:general secretion pathway protein D
MIRRLQLLLLALAFSLPLMAEESLTLNLNNADIRALISTVSEMTGKNFIIDPRVKGKVTVVSASPSSREHIYEIFLSVLKVHGYAVVPAGNVIKIVPNMVAKQDNIPTLTRGRDEESDETVTRVVEIKHINAAQLVPILRPLMPQQAHLAPHADSNTLIISDSSSNLNRIIDIIHRIDHIGSREIEIIPLEYASAADLVQTLTLLRQSSQKGQGAPAQESVMVADQRTNSILLGGSPEQRLEIRALIAHLDTPIEREGNTEVIYLRYAQAKDLMGVLKGIGTQHLAAETEGQKSTASKTQFDIQADEATNALVVTAPPALMRSLKEVINQLDIRRAQVYIEAVIAELSDERAVDFGVQWQSSQNGTGLAASFLQPAEAPALGYGQGFNLGYLSNGNLRAVLNALITDSGTNILSTPSLLTLDNEEASIVVGENVPFVTGQYNTGDNNAGESPFQTIERHDVGIKLKVTPQINEGDTIKLKIEQEVSSVSDSTASTTDLITKKRTLDTSILVDDKQTIVLGGLITDELKETVSKVPLLGDIPLLGNLFKTTSSDLNKKNLMVFLRPEIIRDQRTSQQLTHSKYRHIQLLQENVRREAEKDSFKLIPTASAPLLPPLGTSPADRPAETTVEGRQDRSHD